MKCITNAPLFFFFFLLSSSTLSALFYLGKTLPYDSESTANNSLSYIFIICVHSRKRWPMTQYSKEKFWSHWGLLPVLVQSLWATGQNAPVGLVQQMMLPGAEVQSIFPELHRSKFRESKNDDQEKVGADRGSTMSIMPKYAS